jgi:hypothetical protein
LRLEQFTAAFGKHQLSLNGRRSRETVHPSTLGPLTSWTHSKRIGMISGWITLRPARHHSKTEYLADKLVCPRVDIPWVLHDPSNALWNLTLGNYEEDYSVRTRRARRSDR